MAIPKILFAVPVAVAGLYIPAMGTHLHKLPQGSIGMGHEGYSKKVIRVHVGDRITFQNNSRWIHIIGAGTEGHLVYPKHEPVKSRLLMSENDVYRTGRWMKPGTYYMTCSVHPDMTTKIVVTP